MMLSSSGVVIDWGVGWTWPLPNSSDGGAAVVSQEFRAENHLGVDLMYRDRAGRFFVPEGTPVLAARAGTVWSTGNTARGLNVVLDHGPPWATFYQHLSSVAVKHGEVVSEGQRIGTAGVDPTDTEGVRHLHFETWYKGDGGHAVDPARAMRGWKRLTVG